MSISQFRNKINISSPADPTTEETFSYDKEGNVSSTSWRITLVKKLFLSLTIILVATLSFGIGRLSVVGDRKPITIEYDEALVSNPQFPSSNQSLINKDQTASVINTVEKINSPSVTDNTVIVSKNGLRYHYLHCGSGNRIKEENKIVFRTPEDAEAAGYTLAANCKPR